MIDDFLASHSTWAVVSEPVLELEPPRDDIPFVLQQVYTQMSDPVIYKLRRQLDRQQYPRDCDNLWVDRFLTSGFGFTEAALEYGLTLGTSHPFPC